MPKARIINGFHFSNKFIAIVQYQPEGNAVVSIVIKPLEEGCPDWWLAVSADIKSIVADLKFQNRNVLCALPSEHTVVKRIVLDEAEADVAAALQWEFSQQVIGSVDDYVLDFKKNESRREVDNGGQEYLVVACRREAIKKMSALVRANKLNPVVCDVDIFSLVNVVTVNYPDRISDPVIICEAHDSGCKIILAHRGEFVDCDLVHYAADALAPDTFCARIKDGVASLLASSPQYQGAIAGTFLAGPLFTASEFATYTLDNLENAELINPFKTVACRVEMRESDIKKYAPHLAGAVGLVLRGADGGEQ